MAEEINRLPDSKVESTYELEEFLTGKRKGQMNDVVIDKDGKKILGPDYEGYINESYNETMRREAAENK